MQTFLVTGGTGFIGSNFVLKARTQQWANIVNLDKLTYASNPQTLSQLQQDHGYTFVRGDIADSNLLQRLLNQYQPSAIINFAAESHVDRSILNPQAFIDTNIIGTFQLLQASKAYWEQLSIEQRHQFRFLHVSTDEVFGSLSPTAPAFREDTTYAPNSPYAASKAGSDHLVRAYHHTYGLPTLTTNCSNNYGPRQFPEKLIPLIILNALDSKPLPIYGDGKNIRDWLYVEDHCDAIYQVLQQSQIGETYTIGGNNEQSNLAVVDQICTSLDRLAPKPNFQHASLITFVKDRLGHDRRYAIDCSKIKRDLGWEPKESFESGLLKTIQWYLDNPIWIEQVQSGAYQSWIDQNYANRDLTLSH
ncbi:dTDP-glucose 4,6-dehydratase [Leptolyngbya sp. AN03gr2]|uniref:dTDP-glucose 4,6-dehydratase n=1 Tax=unclassified Leptolyngbya TaxID=2650499 RepID=UPI003D31B3E1